MCPGFGAVVSERLNHSTTHITAEVYSHVTQPIAREAADLVGGLILGVQPAQPVARYAKWT